MGKLDSYTFLDNKTSRFRGKESQNKMGRNFIKLNSARKFKSANCNFVFQFLHFNHYSTLRSFHSLTCRRDPHKRAGPDALDPRLGDIGKVIKDEYAVIRDNYGKSCDFLID